MMGSDKHGSQSDALCTREEVVKFMAAVVYNLAAPGTAHSALQAARTAVGWAGGVDDMTTAIRQAVVVSQCASAEAATGRGKRKRSKTDDTEDKEKNACKATSNSAAGDDTSQNKPRSHYKGVYWVAKEAVYRAFVYNAGKFMHIGYFEDEVSAARACDLALLKLQSEGILDQALQLHFPDANYTQEDIAGMIIPSLQPRIQHSRFTGVYMSKGKWKAEIRHSRSKHHLGTFESEEDAARAFDNAVRHLQQEGVLKRPRKLNFPDCDTQSFTTVQPHHHKQQHGSSKYVGVHWISKTNRWHAQIRHGGKLHYLGQFDVEEDAAKAYDTALLRLKAEGKLASGVLRTINFPVDSYSQEAIMSARVPSNTAKDVSSGYHGVHWKKKSQKWSAAFKIGGIKIHLGLFDCEEDAAAAYDNAIIQEIAQGGLKVGRKLNFSWSEGGATKSKQY